MKKNTVVRFMMLAAMIMVSVAAVLIWSAAMTVSGWIAFGFMIVAQILLFVPGINGGSENFPLRLPLYLFILPGYLIATMVLLFCSWVISWRIMLSAELGAALFVIFCWGISLLVSRPEKGDK